MRPDTLSGCLFQVQPLNQEPLVCWESRVHPSSSNVDYRIREVTTAGTFIEFTPTIFIMAVIVHRYWDKDGIAIFPWISIFLREQEITPALLLFSMSREISFYHSKPLFTISWSSSCLQLEISSIIHLHWQTWIRLAEYQWSFGTSPKSFITIIFISRSISCAIVFLHLHNQLTD